MLDLDSRLCPNRVDVASKVMDGEAILINLSNGLYYSLDGGGAMMWEMIGADHTLSEMARSLHERYDVDLATARADVQRVARELVDANLAQLSSATTASPTPAVVQPLSPRQPYEPLRLNVYRDMAELLALDPPHPLLTDTLSNYTPEP